MHEVVYRAAAGAKSFLLPSLDVLLSFFFFVIDKYTGPRLDHWLIGAMEQEMGRVKANEVNQTIQACDG